MERRREPRFQPAATIDVFVIGEGKACMAGQVIDTSGRGMALRLPAPLPDGTAIKIEAQDELLLGEVISSAACEGAFRVGLVVKHRLAGLAELHRLNRALVGEAPRVSSAIMVE